MNRVKNKLLLSGRKSVLKRAIWAVKANVQIAGGRGLFDLSGHGNHAYFGGNSTTPTTNDPTVLPFRGQKEVWFPRSAGNYLSTTKYIPSSGVFRIEAQVSDMPFTTGDTLGRVIVGVYNTSTNQRAWAFYAVNTDGTTARVNLSTNGSGNFAIDADSPFPSGTPWIGVEFSANAGWCDFLYSSDGVEWTRLGARKTFTPLTLFNPSADLIIGANSEGTSALLSGRVASVRLYQDGAPVRGFNAANCAEPYATVADEVSGTWTLNRSSTGLKLAVVDRDMLALGTDDYLEVADNPLFNFGANQGFTVAAAWRSYSTTAGYLIAKRPQSGIGWGTSTRTDSFSIRSVITDSSATEVDTPNGAWTHGRAFLGGAVRSALGVRTVVNGTVFSSYAAKLGDLTNSLPVRIGARSGGLYLDGEFFSACIFRETLTDADLNRLAVELGVTP